MEKAEWYVDWFNSPYYHLLYNNRDLTEADGFMRNLCAHLKLSAGAKIWDLACGKGRHAISLNKMGYDVTGTDLSVNSISEASKHENDSLHFIVHDMREEFRKDHFDAVFNLFTSIGYFRDSKDNFSVFRHVSTALKPGAVFVIDFFNAEKVCEALKPEYIEKRGEIQFCIRKIIRDNSVIKHIEFSDKGHNYYFEESVSLLRKKDFEGFASAAGLKPGGIFGNYQLQPFNEKESDRLILIFKK